MMKPEITLPELADFLNREPPVFMGCTMPEIAMLLMLSVTLMLPVMIVVWVLVDFFIGFILYMFLVLIFGVGGIRVLQAVKNGKPAGYYQTRILLFKNRFYARPKVIVTTCRYGKNR